MISFCATKIIAKAPAAKQLIRNKEQFIRDIQLKEILLGDSIERNSVAKGDLLDSIIFRGLLRCFSLDLLGLQSWSYILCWFFAVFEFVRDLVKQSE